MADNNAFDARADAVKQRLQHDLVDERGRPAAPEDVDRVVDAKAESFADAPVQVFVPLLIEHQARDELRQQGLRFDVDDGSDDQGSGGSREV